MKIRFSIICILAIIFAIISSTNLLSSDLSKNEAEIKAVLAGYEKAWNDKDANGVIGFYHDDAQIMTGHDRRIVTKKEYVNIIPQRRSKFGKVKFGEPKIEIKDNEAKVSVKGAFNRISANYIFYMVLQGDKWLIMTQEY